MSERDFLIALGRGDISSKQLADTLIRSRTREIRFRKIKKKDTPRVSDIVVRGGGRSVHPDRPVLPAGVWRQNHRLHRRDVASRCTVPIAPISFTCPRSSITA
ncbi:MAG: hypothetical protein R3E89_09560 [Thiolinea sp.]